MQPGPKGVTPPQELVRFAATPAKLSTALRRGLTVRLTGARRGKHPVTASHGRKVVARGTATVGATGAGSVKLTFTRAAKRSLAGKRSAKLTVAGAGARTTVTLKR
jgi:hypothetical protein